MKALTLPPGRERNTYLDNACASEEELRSRVDLLLEAKSASTTFEPKPWVREVVNELAQIIDDRNDQT